jgi:hypothetical protein
MIHVKGSTSYAVDNNDESISDCSSVEENANDVTVVKRKSNTPTKPCSEPKKRKVMRDPRDADSENDASTAITKKRSRFLKSSKLRYEMAYTVEGMLECWNDTSDYGISFRALTKEEQLKEVEVLNKGAAKGMQGAMKSKMLAKNYEKLLAEKLQEHLSTGRIEPVSMFHCAPKTVDVMLANPSFISVDSDRSPGFNSEGGIAVIVSVHDDYADVK